MYHFLFRHLSELAVYLHAQKEFSVTSNIIWYLSDIAYNGVCRHRFPSFPFVLFLGRMRRRRKRFFRNLKSYRIPNFTFEVFRFFCIWEMRLDDASFSLAVTARGRRVPLRSWVLYGLSVAIGSCLGAAWNCYPYEMRREVANA